MEEISIVYHSDWFHVHFICVQAFITGAIIPPKAHKQLLQ